MKNKTKGFTIIELIVVIAIIAILAAIVTTSITKYITKAKEARAESEADSIIRALEIFKSTYGDYPYGNGQRLTSPNVSSFSPLVAPGGTGDPFLLVNTEPHYLSEILKIKWNVFNANYLVYNGFYHVQLVDLNQDGEVDCGSIQIERPNGSNYGQKYFICGNPNCPCDSSTPFRTEPY